LLFEKSVNGLHGVAAGLLVRFKFQEAALLRFEEQVIK
jgi:hypothetical protein